MKGRHLNKKKFSGALPSEAPGATIAKAQKTSKPTFLISFLLATKQTASKERGIYNQEISAMLFSCCDQHGLATLIQGRLLKAHANTPRFAIIGPQDFT